MLYLGSGFDPYLSSGYKIIGLYRRQRRGGSETPMSIIMSIIWNNYEKN